MIKHMRQMNIIVMPQIACAIELLRTDVSEIRRNWKWIASPNSVERLQSFNTLPVIFSRLTALCTAGATVELAAGAALSISPAEATEFQHLLSNLGAHKRATDYFYLALAAPRHLSKQEVQTIFDRCSSNKLELRSREEFALAIDKVVLNAGIEMSQDQMDTEIAKVQSLWGAVSADSEDSSNDALPKWDLDGFYDWYLSVSRRFAVSQLKELWNHIIRFLVAFCNDSAPNQTVLFEELATPKSKNPWVEHLLDPELEMDSLMAAMVRNHNSLCNKVGETTLRQIMGNLASVGSKKSGWLEFLGNCVAPAGKVHVDNAAVVARVVFGAQPVLQLATDTPMLHALIVPNGDTELVEKAAACNFTIDYVCRSAELLAVLCKGNSADNELKVISMISYSQLMVNIISLPLLPPINRNSVSEQGPDVYTEVGICMDPHAVDNHVIEALRPLFERYE